MIENSKFDHSSPTLRKTGEENKNVLNIVTFFNESASLLQDFYLQCPPDNEIVVKSTLNEDGNLTEKFQARKNIFVCTFCQVFSPSNAAITSHIATVHGDLLPSGTEAEKFVSRLQALQNDSNKKSNKKCGRPRKKENSPVIVGKLPVEEPVPGPDGLYWCWKCHRHFKKSRQLSRHVCLEISADNESSNESGANSDSTSDYRLYMNVEPLPWARRPKHKQNIIKNNKDYSNLSLNQEIPAGKNTVHVSEDQTVKTKIYWRDDPDYVHIFENENDRLAFEEHLKSIDYSCVDNLFIKVENKKKRSRRRNCFPNSSNYTCILCRKELNSLTHIRMHCLTHTDVKPFTCPKCSYRSNTKGGLYTHMRNHTGKLFYCSQCNFKSLKKAHLLDHEQTHSSVSQVCKLCKNSYKTLRSLITHVRKYHCNPGGKRYMKSLSSKPPKDSYIKCNICQRRFKSQATFVAHSHSEISTCVSTNNLNNNITNIPSINEQLVLIENPDDNLLNNSSVNEQLVSSSDPNDNLLNIQPVNEHLTSTENPDNLLNVPSGNEQLNELQLLAISNSNSSYQNEMLTIKDPLAELVFNDLLQQKNSESMVMYEDVFQHCQNPNLLTSNENLPDSFRAESSTRALPTSNGSHHFPSAKSILEDCEKTLNLDLINECLRDSNFANEVITESCNQTPKLINNCGSFGLHDMQLTYPDESLINSNIIQNDDLSKNLSDLGAALDDKNYSNEPESAETKLFERCQRAPAYVCCVCQGIFICPSTLKAHLKEHINSNNSFIEQADEEYDPQKMSETDAAIDSVVKILQDPTESCFDNEKELEKLYTSSIKMYFPEVSVLLENDPDVLAILDEISNCDDIF